MPHQVRSLRPLSPGNRNHGNSRRDKWLETVKYARKNAIEILNLLEKINQQIFIREIKVVSFIRILH
jgi:hypothetical protein